MQEEPRTVYGVKEVAGLLGFTVGQVRRFVHAGLVAPQRGPRGELRFSFQDLAFLRLVKGLAGAPLAPRRVSRALRSLRHQLPESEPLSGIRLGAAGRELVARRWGQVWNPESGQRLFDFEGGDASAPATLPAPGSDASGASAEDWYQRGCGLHDQDPERARQAYRRALELDAGHVEARLDLGCLEHAAGRLAEAEGQYRAALELRPDDPTAAFDLGVVLEDRRRPEEARACYQRALAADPGLADAHYNLARLCDRLGEEAAAIRHLGAYRRLTQSD